MSSRVKLHWAWSNLQYSSISYIFITNKILKIQGCQKCGSIFWLLKFLSNYRDSIKVRSIFFIRINLAGSVGNLQILIVYSDKKACDNKNLPAAWRQVYFQWESIMILIPTLAGSDIAEASGLCEDHFVLIFCIMAFFWIYELEWP